MNNQPHYPTKDDPFPDHPFACFFGMLKGEDLQKLADDIDLNGQNHPGIIYQDHILDGRNRYEAIALLNEQRKAEGRPLKAFNYEVFKGSEIQALRKVQSLNIHRRNLDPSQKSAIAVRILEKLEALAKETGTGPSPKGRSGGGGGGGGRKVTQAATVAGCGTTLIKQAKAVKKKDPELFQKIESGEITTTAAYQIVNPKPIEINLKEVLIGFTSRCEDMPKPLIWLALEEIQASHPDVLNDFVNRQTAIAS